MSLADDEYSELMRGILLAEPCRGVCQEPSRLLDHVYIGSQSNAESLRLLRQLGITHVLNCAGYKGPRPTPMASPYEGLGIDYYEFQAEDTDRYDICQHFPEAFRYLDRVQRQGGTVLVHCALGINRSGAVCLGYIMTHSRIPLLEATKIIKDKRRIVLANRHFQRLIVRYARMRGLLDRIHVEESRNERSGSLFDSPRDYLVSTRPERISNGVGVGGLGSSPFRGSVLRSSPSKSSGIRTTTTLPRRTSDGPTSRDFSVWTDRKSGSTRQNGNDDDVKWLERVCERLDRITRMDGYDGAAGAAAPLGYRSSRRSLGSNGPRPQSRRAQSTPRLPSGGRLVSPTTDARVLSESFGGSRPLDFRY